MARKIKAHEPNHESTQKEERKKQEQMLIAFSLHEKKFFVSYV